MPRLPLLLVLLAFISSGCDFDEEYLLSITLPRALELKNTSQDQIDLATVSNSLEAKATFFLEGGSMPSGSKRSWRVTLDAYDDILSGHFVLDGACGDIEPWEKHGTALKPHIVEQADLGKVIVSIPACDG